MSDEKRLIESLRGIASHPAARGLQDDAAVLAAPIGRDLVFTHDMLVEGIHYLPSDPAGDVAWKLLAVNLSDLAAKGARPLGVLMGYTLAGDADWDTDFVAGLARACEHFAVPLLGGDTVALPPGSPRSLGLTAIGEAPRGQAPSRAGARAGDRLWVSGPIGDAGLGLVIARGMIDGPRRLLKAYRLPMPRLAEGQALAPHVHAMADISDGLLIDADRMAGASRLAVAIDLDAVPLSPEAAGFGTDRAARLRATTAGDDYQLLFAAPEEKTEKLLTLSSTLNATFTPVGRFASGAGLRVSDEAGEVPLPERLGYEHGRHS
ncbi:thiamine-phosphate kinase [Flavisphingomonas formosensis]|uniref:thiamine-phosphate kinase n=1 Tax=Flavisphingomonas formosensis TaxID=861534 RepID=UPI0012F75D17|nr:thiamine-phosphate kinase [Sphingomonas formosensis]